MLLCGVEAHAHGGALQYEYDVVVVPVPSTTLQSGLVGGDCDMRFDGLLSL